MSEWKEYGLNEIASFSQGKQIPVSDQFENNLEGLDRFIRIVDFTSDWTQPARYVKKDDKYKVGRNDIVMLRYGTPGKVFRGHEGIIANNMFKIAPDESIVTKEYLYWFLYQDSVYKILMANQSSSTMPAISFKMLSCVNVRVPSFDMQEQISSFFDYIDDKIAVNRRICENLEAQAQALFKHWFIDFAPFKNGKFVESELGMIPEGWRVGKAEDFYTINIGKTPPRAERQWFSESKGKNKIWISISDMGCCGTFISDSKEYLTPEAQSKFNIVMVPAGTILLSFKLTIGRVAIADNELTTNEAIARFILPNSDYREFTYLYLKQYKYGSLGSTSSIATAVNSKIIKSMLFLMPSPEVMAKFSNVVGNLFDEMKILSKESSRLATLRDTLLPKLMSGQIKV